jgi:hypothetical protein
MNEDQGGNPPVENKPFFAIDESTIAEDHSTPPPPSGMVMGQVASQAPTQSTTQFTPTQSSLAPNQLTGQVNTLSYGGQQFAQIQPQKVGFRWGQFLLGITVPWLVIFGTTFLSGLFFDNQDYPNFSRIESYAISPDEDGWFVQTVSMNNGESMDYLSGCCLEDNTTEATIRLSWYYDGQSRPIVEEYVDASTNNYEENDIGAYSPQNQTFWFKSSQFTAEEITIEVRFFDYEADEEYYSNGQNSMDMLFCSLPIVYVVGLVAAFVKGKNALGIGLLCAIPAAILFMPLLFVLLLLMFGF